MNMASSIEQQPSQFWATRNCHILMRDNDLETNRIRQEEVNSARVQNSEQVQKQDEDQQHFTLSNQTQFTQNLHPRQTQPETTATNITYWIKNSSWTFCETCFTLKPQKLLPSYKNKPLNKVLKNYMCR